MNRSTLSFVVVLTVLVSGLGLTGCTSSKATIQKQNIQIDSLRSVIAMLNSDLFEANRTASEVQENADQLTQANQTTQPVFNATKSADIGQTVEILSTDTYFEAGSAQLTQVGVTRLVGVVRRIRQEFPNWTIRIEGYADNSPILGRLKQQYPSNWELSAARSASVARHFQWTHKIDPAKIEVVGFGQYRPEAPNNTFAGRQKNRKVRIAVLPPTSN